MPRQFSSSGQNLTHLINKSSTEQMLTQTNEAQGDAVNDTPEMRRAGSHYWNTPKLYQSRSPV